MYVLTVYEASRGLQQYGVNFLRLQTQRQSLNKPQGNFLDRFAFLEFLLSKGLATNLAYGVDNLP